jgi:hypothetical protein
MQEVVEVGDRHLEPFDRGGEVAGVESIACLWVGGGEVVEGEVEGVLVVDRGRTILNNQAIGLHSLALVSRYLVIR